MGRTVVLFGLLAGLAWGQQELAIGFIPGRGNDAVTEKAAWDAVGLPYTEIGGNDYQLDRLLQFDVIAIGVVAYDQNEDLKNGFQAVKDYIQAGGYVVTVDFQQDSTWREEYLPHPLQLFDDDLEENAGVEIVDHPIWHTPNEIEEDHFIGWGQGDFMADAPHEAKAPWEPLLISNNWPIVVGAEAGRGYVVFNSLQIMQALGRTGNPKIAEVLENFLLWRGKLAVSPSGKMTTAWGALKGQTLGR
ncbi:MAG: hypothetical protein KatS3mg115_2330 [Candidatus Poribacteria bacterium]|nr:MAG: hypothetical protein KatS3mg115_2330 [Candidatus Poribacteria bacterium]